MEAGLRYPGGMTTILLIRHGMTDDVARALSGTAEHKHLNQTGRAQAHATARQLAHLALTAVVSSPLDRARETAEPIAAQHGLAVEIVAALGELEFGDWTGRTMTMLADDQAWRRFNTARSLTRPPAGELMLEVQGRAVTALLQLAEQFPNQTIAAVSHGDVIRSVLLYLLGMPLDFVHRLEVAPARISIVQLYPDVARVLQVNGDTATAIA
jgi:broad specificity phosphatase PhoE